MKSAVNGLMENRNPEGVEHDANYVIQFSKETRMQENPEGIEA